MFCFLVQQNLALDPFMFLLQQQELRLQLLQRRHLVSRLSVAQDMTPKEVGRTKAGIFLQTKHGRVPF